MAGHQPAVTPPRRLVPHLRPVKFSRFPEEPPQGPRGANVGNPNTYSDVSPDLVLEMRSSVAGRTAFLFARLAATGLPLFSV